MNRSNTNGILFFTGLLLMELPLLTGFWINNTGAFFLGLALFVFASVQLCRHQQYIGTFHTFLNWIQKYSKPIVCLVTLVWIALLLATYYSVSYRTWDVGYFSNIVARFAAIGSLDSTLIDRHVLGEHFHPNLLLLTPFFKIYPSVFWPVSYTHLRAHET